ncbi:MAG: diphthine--ammonia ligase [Thaumarchaeota archaeon]|nr:diphthine--ammonia ligase [Nitrososphaerota archaeon]
MRVAVSWSGGKDSCLSLYRALNIGLEPVCLLNIATEAGDGFRVHGLDPGIIADQARALKLPMVQRKASWEDYERVFKESVEEVKEGLGIEGMVFGDIFLEEHREWTLRVCRELGIEAISPLYGEDEKELIMEFLDAGFKAVIVCVKVDGLSKLLGRVLDLEVVKDLEEAGVDLCGEYGEYHTLVLDGPIFEKRIEIVESRIERIPKGYKVLNVLRWRLAEKG